MSRWIEFLCVGLALLAFAGASSSWVHHLGVEYDEAHFYPTAVKIAYGAEEMLPLPHGLTIQHRPIPFLTMPYVGVLDAIVYALPYRLWGYSPLVPRYTNVAIGLLLMIGVWWLVRSQAGSLGGLFALGAVLCDLELLLHFPTNYGPLVLQQLFTIGAILCLMAWWKSKRQFYFFLAVSILALAFHEKLTFLWVLSPLACAAAITHWKEIRSSSRWYLYPLGLLLALVIVSPILYFTYHMPEVVLGFGKQNTGLRAGFLQTLGDRWHSLDLMLRGTWMMEFTAGPVPAEIHRGAGLLLLFLLSFFVPHRGAQLMSLTALGIWVWNLFFPEAGRMHHVLLLAPLWQCAIGIGFGVGFGAANRWAKIVLAVLLLWAGWDTLRCLSWYSVRTQATGGANHWSDITAQAAEWLERNDTLMAVTPSWGVSRPVFALSGGKVDVEEHYFETLSTFSKETRELISKLIGRRRVVWLVSDVMPVYGEQWSRIEALAKEMGRTPRPVAIFPSRDDRFHLRAYRFDAEDPPLPLWRAVDVQAGAVLELPPHFDFLRIETQARASQEGQHLTLEWLDENGKLLFIDSRPMYWLPLLRSTHRFDFGDAMWPATFTRRKEAPGVARKLRISWDLGGGSIAAKFSIRSSDEVRAYPDRRDQRIGEYGDANAPTLVTERAGELVVIYPDGRQAPLTSLPGRRLPEPNRDFRIRLQKPLEELRKIAAASTPPKQGSSLRAPDLVNLESLSPSIRLDIRYATENNFMGAPLYSRAVAYLQKPAAQALLAAHEELQASGFGILVHDAYRPWRVTKMFWEATPEAQRNFVANPQTGSRHNRGCAVDLSLYDLKTGLPVEMPSGFDEFSPRAYPDYPGGNSRQRWLRGLLRQAMERQGFTVNDDEWWHFDYKDWRLYPVLNLSFEELAVR